MIRTLVAATLLALAPLASLTAPAMAETKTAIFAGGCFWCVESDFDHVDGVTETTSGYIGGDIENPTYGNHEGNREAVEIKYDDAKVDYQKLLKVFFRSVDPTDGGGQFCDRGHSYTTGIYAIGDEQLAEAKKAKADAGKELGKDIATEIVPAPKFWPAEGYHQNYYLKNPLRYKYYRYACGRDARVEELWGDDVYAGAFTH